jgi:hypothetical protein
MRVPTAPVKRRMDRAVPPAALDWWRMLIQYRG